MIVNGQIAVAGVPSERLSQLASPQLAGRPRRENALGGDHSALKDGISAVLRPEVSYRTRSRDSGTPRSPVQHRGYAGKSTCKINEAAYNHGCKKQSTEANKSNQVTGLFSSCPGEDETCHHGTRSLKQYFSSEDLSEAFCTKFHVTDPLTGRTEIMTARKPGRASAEVNVADFDAYMLRRVRSHSMKKAKDNIDHDILGLMPKPNTEAKAPCSYHVMRHQAPRLECKDAWMIPTEKADVCKPLGMSKRRNVFPWTHTQSDNIAHIYENDRASPCISPAFIQS